MNEDEQIEPIEQGAAGAPEGTPAASPEADEVSKMYDELGIKAPKPTGKAKGRPKSAKVRAEDVSDDDDADTKHGRKEEKQSKGKSKDAPTDDQDGDAGDKADSKSKEVGKDSAGVPEESKEADSGVRGDKSKSKEDSKSGSEGDSNEGDEPASEAAENSDDESEEDLEGKRPGKSDPRIEKRFQRLTEEKRERDELIEKLQRELQETTQKHQQAQVSQEDPEYTIDDFRKVQDEDGNVIDLDPERAELAWRRWKDGYEQRGAERQAESHRQAEQEQQQAERSEQIMRQSVEAYDTIAGLMDDYPQLVSTSGQFDAEFANIAMPLIHEAVEYQPGTEPGNEEGVTPVIMGLKIHPKKILEAMDKIQKAKRSLPLNGVNDNVEARSNVAVTHGRSSDPTVNAANDLYKQLGIKNRV